MHRIPSPIVSPRPRRARPGASNSKAGSSRVTGAYRRAFEQLEGRVLFAAGDFDTTFGGDGSATADFASGADFGSSVVIQGDGNIVVGGTTGDGSNGRDNFALARFTPAGVLDTTFGGGTGRVTHNLGGDDDVQAVAVAPGGKIVAVGSTRPEFGSGAAADWAITRYNSDGTVDSTFGGGDGIVTTNFFNLGDTAYGVAVQGDGKIVVTGI